ncbi:MAG TPA: ComEA family DNA-binding protein [Mycobacteriales bacterium]|nr:ComEA family DNA-binding protein [Mycobacteriales bacterium]
MDTPAGPSSPDAQSPAQPVGDGPLAARWESLVERWSPEGLRGARLDPGRRGAAALAAVVLVSATVVSVLVWRSRPEPEPVRPPPVLAAPAAPSVTAPGAASAPSLVVAVTGRVRRPGVVTVPAGARVIDALRAAGGPLPGADLAMLNLARKLADGELVVVGLPGAPSDPAAPGSAGAGAAGGQVDLNTATLEQLDGLPGVGPVLAQRILDWRAEHGHFATVDQLREVSGIGDAKFTQLRDRVRV